MPLQDFFQPGFVQVGLLEQLFNARLVLLPSHAGGNGNDMFSAEDFRGHAFEFDAFGLAHGFPGQSAGSKELHRESAHQKMFTLDLPALCLQVRVDGRDAGGQALVSGNKKDVRVVGGERLDVINRRQSAAERPPDRSPPATRRPAADWRMARWAAWRMFNRFTPSSKPPRPFPRTPSTWLPGPFSTPLLRRSPVHRRICGRLR